MSMDQTDIPVREDLVAVTVEQQQTQPDDASLTKDIAIDDSSIDNVLEPQSDNPKVKKKQARVKQRRNHKYQSHDLIREISPKPDNQLIPLSKQEANPIDRLDCNSSDNQETLLDQPEVVDEQKKTLAGNHPVNERQPGAAVSLNGKRNVQCNLCQRHMTESRLANHIRLLHVEIGQKSDENSSTKRKEFRCEYCGKSYAIKYTYEQHLRTHTEGRPKCPECGATFASAFSLFRHRAKSHNIEHNYTTHTCDQCDKIFFSSSELALHKQRHSSEKVHVCLECKKAFSAKGNLQIHMRTHAKEKLYKCDICENTFSHPYSLVSHRRIHTNEFPFTCPECGKSYRSKHQLTSHKNVHSDNRPYQCDLCEKTFRSRTAFKMHQDQHNGIKRFACKFCDRKFQCQANKAKHERRHLGIKRFKCDDCDKSFIEKQELRNHQKVHKKVSKTKEASKGDSKRTRKKPDVHEEQDATTKIKVSSS